MWGFWTFIFQWEITEYCGKYERYQWEKEYQKRPTWDEYFDIKFISPESTEQNTSSLLFKVDKNKCITWTGLDCINTDLIASQKAVFQLVGM